MKLNENLTLVVLMECERLRWRSLLWEYKTGRPIFSMSRRPLTTNYTWNKKRTIFSFVAFCVVKKMTCQQQQKQYCFVFLWHVFFTEINFRSTHNVISWCNEEYAKGHRVRRYINIFLLFSFIFDPGILMLSSFHILSPPLASHTRGVLAFSDE